MSREEVSRVRECACPEWVTHCAHLGDRWVLIHPGFFAEYLPYTICSGWGAVSTGNDYFHEHCLRYLQAGDEVEALAHFREFEEELRATPPTD